MSDNRLDESVIKDMMNKAGLGEQSDDFIQQLNEQKKNPKDKVLEEAETKKWSSEYQDKIEREMPDALFEDEMKEGMGKMKYENEEEDEMEMGGEPEMDDEMGEPEMDMDDEMGEPEMDMDGEMGEPEMGGGAETDVTQIVQAIADAISAETGMQVSVEGGAEMGEPEMGEPEMDDEMGEPEMGMDDEMGEPEMGMDDEMGEPEMGDEPEMDDEVLEQIVNEVMDEVSN